jgi:hypothetical protein
MGEQCQHCLQARERQVQLLKETSATARDLYQLSLAYMFLGDAAMDFKDLRKAEGYYTSALTVAESLLDQHSDYSLAWTGLGAANSELVFLEMPILHLNILSSISFHVAKLCPELKARNVQWTGRKRKGWNNARKILVAATLAKAKA